MSSELKGEGAKLESRVGLSRKEQIFEVCVFLFLIVPSLAFSFFAINQGSVGFVLTAVATILRDLALVALILFFIWRNSEHVRHLGWAFRHGWADVGLGILLFIPFFFGAAYLDSTLQRAGFSSPSAPTPGFLTVQGPLQFVLAFVLVVVVALSEETIFRGYLMLRFGAIMGSPAAAVILSAFVFSLGHGYEGSAGVVTVGVMGLVFALVYLWRGSLVAPIVMHFLQDFIGIVLLPLLGG